MKTTNFLKRIIIYLFFTNIIGVNLLFAQQTIWKHSTGSFRLQNDNVWIEYTMAKVAFSFVKHIDSNYDQTILYDKSRDCFIRLTRSECFVSFNRRPYQKYYDGGWSTNIGFDDEMGTKTKTQEEIKAIELQNKKTQLEIAEIERKRKEEADAKRAKEAEIIRKETAEREAAEKQRLADDIKRVKEEDKAVGGANTRLKNGLIGGNFEMVKKAIAEKANPAAVYEKGENTLFFALGNAKILDYLIEKGADVTQQREQDGFSPLHLVENLDAAMILIKYSRDINITNTEGTTPLEVAISKNKSDIANYLIDKGANINGKPLALACGMNETPIQIDVVKKLLSKGAKPNDSPNGYDYPLHLAAKNNNYELAMLLIDKGADPDKRDFNGRKAKSYAKDKDLRKLLKD
jgi:ankyrin repeat protein